MVSAAMTTQEQHVGTRSSGPMPSIHETVSSEADKGLALSKQQLNPVDEVLPKVRKPYTITKQRERWTDEEHKKFLEALKLYGRAWRKIEEHVGTKTAVQIRSHAQKFFSKVTRDSNGGEDINLKPIEIPPPRPKRKPMHPYPRKEVAALVRPRISIPEKQTSSVSLSTDLSGSEQDKQSSSPTSVLSAINGSLSPVSSNLVLKVGGSFGSEAPNTSSDDNHSVLARDDFSLDESASGQRLKLFGKTLVFADNQGSPDRNECTKDLSPKRVVPVKCIMNGGNMNSAAVDACSPFHLTWLTLSSGLSLSTTTEILSPTPIKACFKCSDGSNESSSVQSDFDDRSNEERSRVVDSCSSLNLEFKGQVKILGNRISADSLKGFVPYKGCVMDRDSSIPSADNPDEREKQRIRLCT